MKKDIMPLNMETCRQIVKDLHHYVWTDSKDYVLRLTGQTCSDCSFALEMLFDLIIHPGLAGTSLYSINPILELSKHSQFRDILIQLVSNPPFMALFEMNHEDNVICYKSEIDNETRLQLARYLLSLGGGWVN